MITQADRERLRDFTIRPGEVRALADKLLDALYEAERERDEARALVRELAKRECERVESVVADMHCGAPCGVCLTCRARALETGGGG
jgi:hypothetical protein